MGSVTSVWTENSPNLVIHGDNLDLIRTLPDESFQLIYLDPPFNTGKKQTRMNVSSLRHTGGSRVGFRGSSYTNVRKTVSTFNDDFEDYWAFLEPRLEEAWRLLALTGTLYLHLDYRESHYAKVLLDALFGRDCFLNEIIWAYDYGARTKSKWPAKHDNILVYVKDPKRYHFNSAEVAANGKLPTDVWWHTIVSPTGREKTGYATQKPEGVLRRIVQASSNPGDWVLDFFAGSGTLGAVAAKLGRRFVLIDNNAEAISVMAKRLGDGSAAPIDFVEYPGAAERRA